MEEEKKYCVYQHTNKINGKVYIGQTCKPPKKRWNNGAGYKRCTLFYHAIQKYGWDNFEHEILLENLTLKEANEEESKFIKYFKSNNPKYGYNIREGGSNSPLSQETKNKLSEIQKKRNFKISPEQRQAMIEGIRKSPNMSGHKTSEETKEKLRKAMIGRTPTNFNDLTGQEINGWKIIKRVENRISKAGSVTTCWECVHTCKNPATQIIAASEIGTKKYCKNCLDRRKLGYANTKLYYEWNGETHSLKEWSEILGVKYSTLRERIKTSGMTIEEAFSKKLYSNSKNIGRKMSEESKHKVSVANKGKKRTKEQLLNNSKNKKCKCVETNIVYFCIKDASRNTKIDASSILRCCKNAQKTAGGYHWEYVEENT